MKAYLISICIAAVICSIFSTIVPAKGTNGMLLKLLSGLFMLYTLLSPLVTLKLQDFTEYWDDLTLDAESAVSAGTLSAQMEKEKIIMQQTQAYILEKAKSLGAELSVEVLLSNGIPDEVNISGAASPYVKSQITALITDDLGIEAEAQHWND